jgi:hypothetical protein
VSHNRRAALKDACHSSGLAEARQIGRLAIKQYRVELVTRGDSSQAVRHTTEFGSHRSRGQQRLLDTETGSMQQGELREVAPVIDAVAEISAERYLHPRCTGDLDSVSKVFPDRDRP